MSQADSLLYLDGVSVTFDGFRALNELSLAIEPGEMRAVIGPNGAGKTTMMDVVTGKTRPDAGQVVFGDDTDLTRLDEPAIAALGIGRKFQKPTVFESHSVSDNCCSRWPAAARRASRCSRGRAPTSGAASRKSSRRPGSPTPAPSRRRAVAWSETMARDRHAAGAGTAAVAARRAGRRDERRRDRADRRTAARHQPDRAASSSSSTTWRSCARSTCGSRCCTRVGAVRRIDRPCQRRPARYRSLSRAEHA